MSDPFRLPLEAEIDLHAFSPRDISSLVGEYVDAAAAAGIARVRLIHGRGRGVQRGIVQAALDRHPRVIEFWDDTDAHLGATIARLAIDKPQSTGVGGDSQPRAGGRERAPTRARRREP